MGHITHLSVHFIKSNAKSSEYVYVHVPYLLRDCLSIYKNSKDFDSDFGFNKNCPPPKFDQQG